MATHKVHPLPDAAGYVPIHAGKAGATLDLGLPGDDTGDHISDLNPFYSEVTVLYWIWRNADCAQVGLTHYRRYFAGLNHFAEVGGVPIAAANDFHELDHGFDLVIPVPARFRFADTAIAKSVEQQYVEMAHGWDLLTLRRTIRALTPEYGDAYDFVMRNNCMSICNMFVGKKVIIDQYCEWLFKIFFAMQSEVPCRSYDFAYQRAFGFMAERLFNVWIARNWKDLRVAYRRIVGIT